MEPALRNLTNLITTGLDVLGLLALAAGVGAWSVGHADGRGLAVAGAIVLAGSWWFARQADPNRVRVLARVRAGTALFARDMARAARWAVAHWPHPIRTARARAAERAYHATAAKAGAS